MKKAVSQQRFRDVYGISKPAIIIAFALVWALLGAHSLAAVGRMPTVNLNHTNARITNASNITKGITNSAPIAVNDYVVTGQETAVSIPVLANDSDPDNDTLTVTAVSPPANGLADTHGTLITYTPYLNFVGSDGFTYTLSDGNSTVTATVIVDVYSSFWQEDIFDDLIIGPLAGQNGWQLALPDRTSPQVVSDGSDGNLLKVDAAPGETISILKDIPDQTTGTYTFVVLARVLGETSTTLPTLAKITFDTDAGNGWGHKFQLYFGAHFRINYHQDGSAVIFLPDTQLQTERWYHIRGVVDMDQELLDIWLDNVQVADDIPMSPGSLTNVGMEGWDRGRTDYVEIDNFVGFQDSEGIPPTYYNFLPIVQR